MKKVKIIGIILLTLFMVTACGEKSKNIDGTLEEIMTKVYEGISEDDLPMMLTNIEITKENIKDYIGTDEIEITEGIASESMVGSIAHSVILLRVDDNADVKTIKEKIKESVNPNKWICVGVENVTVESKGNLIIVILDDTTGDIIKTNFENL